MNKMVIEIPKRFLIPWKSPEHGCLNKWRKRVRNAIKEGRNFTARENAMAADWKLCACGEAYCKFDGLTANAKGDDPRDEKLNALGMKFCEVVRPMKPTKDFLKWHSPEHWTPGNPKKALKVLDQIEKRLIQLDRQFRRRYQAAMKAYMNGSWGEIAELFRTVGKEIE